MIDFIHPETSTGYNFFHYIRSTKDIIKIAHMLMTCNGDKGYYGKDPFWEEAAELDDKDAINQIGMMYYDGTAGEVNYTKAIE